MTKVGFFDSGVGGLTVLEAARTRIPNLSFEYFGDTAHCPYGDRPLDEVESFALNAVEYLASQGCNHVVMACNISSSIALQSARSKFPDLTVHGLINEKLVRRISRTSTNDRVGVMATVGTVKSKFYPKKLRQADLNVIQQSCSPLVPMIESGQLDGELVEQTLQPLIDPLIEENVDTIVLGCTHYPLLAPVISRLLGSEVELIDPGEVMADHLLNELPSENGASPIQNYVTTGTDDSLKHTLRNQFGREAVTVDKIEPLEARTQ